MVVWSLFALLFVVASHGLPGLNVLTHVANLRDAALGITTAERE
jgi:hypothetical protein